jgi:hypothetical protein
MASVKFPSLQDRAIISEMSRPFLLGIVMAVFSGLVATSDAAQIQNAATPTLLGRVATQLTSQDVANLEAVLPSGAKTVAPFRRRMPVL